MWMMMKRLVVFWGTSCRTRREKLEKAMSMTWWVLFLKEEALARSISFDPWFFSLSPRLSLAVFQVVILFSDCIIDYFCWQSWSWSWLAPWPPSWCSSSGIQFSLGSNQTTATWTLTPCPHTMLAGWSPPLALSPQSVTPSKRSAARHFGWYRCLGRCWDLWTSLQPMLILPITQTRHTSAALADWRWEMN